jgi:hypothetical protein
MMRLGTAMVCCLMHLYVRICGVGFAAREFKTCVVSDMEELVRH